MSTPLKDFRTALSNATLAALEAEAVAAGTDMQTAARDILNDWARRKHLAYTVYARRVMANGMQVELPGLETAEHGTRRNRRR